MAGSETVKVFSFRELDVGTSHMRLSTYKATREAIASKLHGDLLEGTGQDVRRAELDEQGRYRRIATGWGELD